MFIELCEFLRCTGDHDEGYCVVTPDEMVGRDIVQGTIGCPRCRRAFPIHERVADFVPAGASAEVQPAPVPLDPPAIQALCDLAGVGGYVVLVGSAARVAPDLAALCAGVHFVGVNAPRDVSPSPALSLIRGIERIPLRSAMARAVVIGGEFVAEPWCSESVRVLLRGLRLVLLGEGSELEGVMELVAGRGTWVGTKR